MYRYVGYVLLARVRTKMRKGLEAFLIHLCTVYLVSRKKKSIYKRSRADDN